MYRTAVRKSRKHTKLSVLSFVVLSLVSITGIALWSFKSVQVFSVESASMAPTIKRGDAVVLKPVTTSSLKVGDIVSFRSPADQSVIITHRIIEVQKSWSQVITRGDNVSRADKPLPMAEVIGKVDVKVRYLGFALNFLRSPAGLIVGVYAPALIIVVLELKRLGSYYARPTYRLSGYAKH